MYQLFTYSKVTAQTIKIFNYSPLNLKLIMHFQNREATVTR